MKGDYSRSVSMQCSTCAGTEFEHDEDDGPMRCTGCDRVYAREELVRENGARIEAEVDEVKSQIVADIHKDFSKMFKKFK